MTKPEILSEIPITMEDVKEEIKRIKKRDEELNFRVKNTEEYLDQFAMLSKKQSEELYKKVEALNIPRLRDIHITKIVDILPRTKDEFKVLIQGYPITISQENVKKVVSAVNEFLGDKK